MVDVGLGKHRVVLELRLAQGRGVAGNDDQLGLARSQGLEGGLVAQGDCASRSVVLFGRSLSMRSGRTFARLHHQRQARVDAVGGLLALLGCHLCASRDICLNILSKGCCAPVEERKGLCQWRSDFIFCVWSEVPMIYHKFAVDLP